MILDQITLASVLSLASEVRDMPRGSRKQRMRFLRGVGELVGADVAIWVRARRLPDGFLVEESNTWGQQMRDGSWFLRCYTDRNSSYPDPLLPLIASLEGPVFVLRRQDLIDDQTWYASPHVQQVRRRAGVDHCLYAGRLAETSGWAVSLHRKWHAPPFTETHRDLIDVLFNDLWQEMELAVDLPPRLARVLDGFCRGLGEKQVAEELKLSPHTVHSYAKELYSRFKVRSRAELLAKALSTSSPEIVAN